MELSINLNTIDKVKEFVKESEKLPYSADLASGRYVVDAKSLLGIFSLDLSKSVKLIIHADEDDCEPFLAWLRDNEYIAKLI